jgi:histidine ammonia-lyase
MNIYEIDGYNLTIEQIEKILSDPDSKVQLSTEAAYKCRASRKQIDRWLQKDSPVVYGVNTGLGNLKDVVVPPEQHIQWNKCLPYPHAAGMGDYLPATITRLSLLLRANVLARSFSAVRVELIDRILDLFNHKISPAVHSEGSTGLSDLAPLAQCIMVIAGLEDASAYYNGELMPAKQALTEAGLESTFDLECKEVLAIMNGSTMTQAIAVYSFIEFEDLFAQHTLLFKDSILSDKLSAYNRTVEFAREVLNFENNISCDNPLLFEVGLNEYEAVMGCNCSNTQVGYILDLMSIIVCEIGSDIDSIIQSIEGYTKETSSHLMAKLKTASMQVSADSIPTKSGQEDHVEFSFTAAKKFFHGVRILKILHRISADY